MEQPSPTKSENKVILFTGLDEITIEWRPYKSFLILYIFNATVALPFFILKMGFLYIQQIVKNIKFFRFTLIFKTLLYFIIDFGMAISILMMYILAILKIKISINYGNWALSCLIFLQSQILMSSYVLTISADRTEISLDFLFSEENMGKLGLGRLYSKLLQQNLSTQKIEELKQNSLFQEIKQAMAQENIDSTLYYIALDKDEGIVSINDIPRLEDILENKIQEAKFQLTTIPEQQSNRYSFETIENKITVLRTIRTLGFRGTRHAIDNFLWPHYDYIKVKQEGEPLYVIIIIMIFIIAKGCFPLFLILANEEYEDIELIFFLCFLGMYLNMIILLMEVIKCNDLKWKRYVLNVLQTLIIPNKAQDQLDNDDDSDKEEIPQDLPFNIAYKLDLSCNLSLESWDNLRRLTLIIDNEKMAYNEAQIAFVFLYFIYLYLDISSVFLNFDLIPGLHHFFQDPILKWNMIIDFICLALLFLNRVYQGTLFNSTFDNIIESIKKIEQVYDDKKALFEFYFSNNLMENIQNETYRKITQRIYCSACDKVLLALAKKGDTNIQQIEFLALAKAQAKIKVNQLCATMRKVKDQIEFDNDHYCHKMLSIYRSNIWAVLTTFFFLAYVFFRGEIKDYLNKHKVKQQ